MYGLRRYDQTLHFANDLLGSFVTNYVDARNWIFLQNLITNKNLWTYSTETVTLRGAFHVTRQKEVVFWDFFSLGKWKHTRISFGIYLGTCLNYKKSIFSQTKKTKWRTYWTLRVASRGWRIYRGTLWSPKFSSETCKTIFLLFSRLPPSAWMSATSKNFILKYWNHVLKKKCYFFVFFLPLNVAKKSIK